jgi:hypothetical protein
VIEMLMSILSLPGLAGVLAGLAALGGGMAWLLSRVRSGARAEERSVAQRAQADALRRMQEAEARGARSREDVARRMEDGTL